MIDPHSYANHLNLSHITVHISVEAGEAQPVGGSRTPHEHTHTHIYIYIYN